ncbi:hypothetical protein EV183_005395 [Coemansia sp. RSA 2336]|nr:hypothetical protein EV183_005395 [Coemansia sp. RSA 2336]
MQRSETKSPGLVGYAVLAVASMLSWMMVVPRAISSLLTSTLDLLENVVLTLLWEYQGEAPLSYSLKPKPQTRSRMVQTDTAAFGGDKQERHLAKLVDETVPTLLKALQSIPDKAEIQNMLSQQADLTSDRVAQAHTQLLKHLQQRIVEDDTSAYVRTAMHELARKVGTVEEQLAGMHNNGSGPTCMGEHMYNTLIDDFRNMQQQQQASSEALYLLSSRVADVEAMLAKSMQAKQVSDAAVATDHADIADRAARSSETVHNDSSSEKTIERTHNPDSYKSLHRSLSTATAKSHRFSLRKELKRRSLFGKRPT